MTDSAFDTLAHQVENLRIEHGQLSAELPKLKEQKRQDSEELLGVQRQLTVAKAALEGTEQVVEQQTNAYNIWQRAQLKELEVKRGDFDKHCKQLEQELATRAKTLTEASATIKRGQEALEEEQNTLKRKKVEASAAVRVNNKQAQALAMRESVIEVDRDANLQEASRLAAKTAELDEREQKLKEVEEQVVKLHNDAQTDREATKTLLDEAKETILANDTREKGLNIREKVLNNKESDLHTKEIALNDQRDVLIANKR